MQTGLDEECERELQVEIDVEKEAERQIPKMRAAEESDWDYDGLLCNGTCRTAAMVPTSLSLQTAVRETMQTKFLDIAWADVKVFCTLSQYSVQCAGWNSQVEGRLPPFDSLHAHLHGGWQHAPRLRARGR